MKIRLAQSTERFIEHYSQALPHAVILTGITGVGLNTLANHIAARNGRVLARIYPESKTSSSVASINVERIRQLYVETRSKLDGVNFVIIDDADTMNHVAQNALLKLLEEPNDSINFILTTHNPDKLLPTIRSRAQSIAVAPINELESSRHLTALGISDPTSVQRMLYVASGLPAEIHRLATNETDFRQLLERVQTAKQVVEGSPYQRLSVCLRTSNDRSETLKLLQMILLLLRRSVAVSADQSTIKFMSRIITASESIGANGNVKLHLARAVLQ